jgi:hypothetical protein
MLHDDINRRLQAGIHWPGFSPAPPSPPPRAEPIIRSELFDQLAAVHESAHCTWNWVHREPIHSVEIEGRGIGGGEFKATPTSGTIELGDNDDARTRAALDLRLAGKLLDPGTRESWLARLPGFVVTLFAQRKYGARGPHYDASCRHDVEVVDRVINVVTEDPAERQRLRERVYSEAREFVDQHWPMIERLGDEIFRRGKLDKREIEEVLAPKPPPAPAKRALLESNKAERTVHPRIAAVFHEAGHILAGLRQGLTIKSCSIDTRGGGRATLDDPAPGDERGALQRFCVMALAGGLSVERLTGTRDGCGDKHDLAAVNRRIAHLPADERASFLREARAAAQRVIDRDWNLISELARHLHRRGALDRVDVLNVLNLAPARAA